MRHAKLCAEIALIALRGIAMATETQERTNVAANRAERATKPDIAELSAKVDQHEVELSWIRWVLIAIAMLLIVLCGAALAIALQI